MNIIFYKYNNKNAQNRIFFSQHTSVVYDLFYLQQIKFFYRLFKTQKPRFRKKINLKNIFNKRVNGVISKK